jgi:hypothetical protein
MIRFLTIFALLFTTVTAVSLEQKIRTEFPLEDTSVPATVTGKPTPLTGVSFERGPVSGLVPLAKEPTGAVWFGSPNGAARFDAATNHPWDRWQYFWGKRWLADNDVQNIWVDGDAAHRTVWIRTKTGVSKIEWVPMSFRDKAAHFDEVIEKRHLRHDFVAASSLPSPGDTSRSITRDNDNDGLWTAMYLGAQAYRYAATKDPDARMKARRSLDAIIRLEEINPMPGYYSRSFVSMDEPTPRGGEWHPTTDGKWLWKSDTSSDETVGHYYAYALYYDLVATEEEKPQIREKVALITDRMIKDNYYLLDLDGKPTRWGNWNETYYETEEGAYEKALRSLELLSFLKTAYHITEDPKYQEAYWERIGKGYAEYTREFRRWSSEFSEINFSDDELYYISVLPLMLYETDPKLREIYLDGMRFTWSQIASDWNPLWNYINAACGIVAMNPRIQDESRRTLERSPWEAIEWRVENSHRLDFAKQPEVDRHGNAQVTRVIPPDERGIHKHNSSPYYPDRGGNGTREEAPTYWLLPYWMGVYYGWIE